MPGKVTSRNTTFHYQSIRAADYYDLHRLAGKLGLSYADTLHLIISERLHALGLEPTDIEQQQGVSED